MDGKPKCYVAPRPVTFAKVTSKFTPFWQKGTIFYFPLLDLQADHLDSRVSLAHFPCVCQAFQGPQYVPRYPACADPGVQSSLSPCHGG